MLAPKVDARLLQELALQRHERALEVGSGSGYMAALLAHRAQHVTTLEIDPELARLAADNLKKAWISNVTVLNADASRVVPEGGPFDAIVLSGSVAELPRMILAQLKAGGRLVGIVGQLPIMRAVLVTRTGDGFATVELFDTVAPRLKGFGEPSRFVHLFVLDQRLRTFEIGQAHHLFAQLNVLEFHSGGIEFFQTLGSGIRRVQHRECNSGLTGIGIR